MHFLRRCWLVTICSNSLLQQTCSRPLTPTLTLSFPAAAGLRWYFVSFQGEGSTSQANACLNKVAGMVSKVR